ncbi:MAG: nitrate reductase [Alicyclobacillus sp. RIFOXYA1_FULL_53_8]|nr:MAG: nitrate reductase [Alicyclobacillus sp. RIFOXYA1_FULL_53_8]
MSWENERIDINVYSQGDIDKWVYSTCNLCSVGCGCYIAVKDQQIVGIKGNGAHPINRGRLGPKGEHQWYANHSKDRLLQPLLRNRSGQLVPASWDEALGLFVEKTQDVLHRMGSDAFAIYSTGQAMLEDYYTLGKIGRAGLGTHVIDANARLCTSSVQWGWIQSFGVDGVPASYEDVDQTDTLLLFGHNVAETGTVLWERIVSRKQKTGKPYLIVVDPRKTLTAQRADLFLQLYPGTNVALLNGILHLLLRHGFVDEDFVQMHTIGYEELEKSVAHWTPAYTAQITGLPIEQIEAAARQLGTTRSLVSTALQGAFQSTGGSKSSVLMNNIHLIRGLIGKPGSGPLQMAGQSSATSNRNAGGAGPYPGQRNPDNPRHIEEMAQLWNVEAASLPVGGEESIEEMINRMESNRLGLIWNIHTNPMVSLPNRRRARQAFEKVFVVVQDPFLTETTEVADIVLPTAMWGEKEGVMENSDRTVNLLRKAVAGPAGVRSDFEILLSFAKGMGFKDRDGQPLIGYTTPEACFEEWKRLSRGRFCDMTGMTYAKLESHNGMQWPAPDTSAHPRGTVRLYEDLHFRTHIDEVQSFGRDINTGRSRTMAEFAALHAEGRAILYAVLYEPPAESPSRDYPFWLTTGRLLWQWHTRTKTGRAPHLHLAAPQGYVEINAADAQVLAILPGELVRIESPRSWIEVPARVVDTIQRGLVFVPFHFGSWQHPHAANELTVDFVDPVSKQPVFKQASCRIVKLRQNYAFQTGDTLAEVAKSHQLTLEQLAHANRLMPPYRVDVGTELEIPLSMVDVVIPPYLPYREVDIKARFEQSED